MDMILICRDALASSLLTNLVTAIEAKRSGVDVGVLFTEEALTAICRGVFLWPRELREQEVRYKMADNAKQADIPIWGRGQWRQIDAFSLLSKAAEAGVPMFACPLWTGLLELDGEIPRGVTALNHTELLEMLRNARTVIGAL